MRTPATEGEIDSQNGRSIASKARNLQRGLQLQKGRSTRTVYKVLHEAGQTYREDSSYIRGGQLAPRMVYYIESARPTERIPATEDEVDSRSRRVTTSSGRDPHTGLQLQRARSTRTMHGVLRKAGEAHREDSSYRGRRQLAQRAGYEIEWARRTERTPATEREVDSLRAPQTRAHPPTYKMKI